MEGCDKAVAFCRLRRLAFLFGRKQRAEVADDNVSRFSVCAQDRVPDLTTRTSPTPELQWICGL
jgi:hypothetical protein